MSFNRVIYRERKNIKMCDSEMRRYCDDCSKLINVDWTCIFETFKCLKMSQELLPLKNFDFSKAMRFSMKPLVFRVWVNNWKCTYHWSFIIKCPNSEWNSTEILLKFQFTYTLSLWYRQISISFLIYRFNI